VQKRSVFLIFIILGFSRAYGQDRTLNCQCHQIQGGDYVCSCKVVSGTTPASFNFSAVANEKAAGPAKTAGPAKSAAESPAPKTGTTAQAAPPGSTDTGQTTAAGKEVYEGPRGGLYTISPSGKKVYQRKK
jgi:hypothetical protein